VGICQTPIEIVGGEGVEPHIGTVRIKERGNEKGKSSKGTIRERVNMPFGTIGRKT
jgi:hypothetical protein